MKTHKKGLDCGTHIAFSRLVSGKNENTTENNEEVTCKKCLKLIRDEKISRVYEVSFDNWDCVTTQKNIKAASSSSAIYKCFKSFSYNDEASESIAKQFNSFLLYCEPKAKLLKDKNIKPSLTYEEEIQLKKDEARKRANEFNEKYPIGTKVLFQGDFKNEVIVTTTRSEAIVYSDYLTIFLDGVSGSYLLDDRFVRVLTDENMNLESLR